MQPRARSLAVLTFATFALGAGALHAGTVYVPLPGVATVGTASWEAEITIANPSGLAFTVDGLLLANDTDGTQRGAGTPYSVGAGGSLLLRPGAGFVGLAELAGSPNARVAARLTGKGAVGQLGTALPVITSANTVPGGRALALQGLASSVTRSTAVDLVNLGKASATCTLDVVGYNGASLAAQRSFTLKPLSQLLVGNVFAGLGAIVDARVAVSCTREFFAFAVMTDSATGEVSTVVPSGSGESSLTRPGEEPACPAGATCLASSILFRPTPADPVGHVVFPAPAGTYKRLRLSLDVTIGEWYAADPDGKHLIYWWVINKNLDMPGMLYFRGNETFVALARWGIGLKHELKKKHTEPFQGIPGHTYRVVTDTDFGGGTYTVTITDLGTGQVVTMLDTPNVAQVVLKATDRFLIDLGFKEGLVIDEVPSFNGWVYTNVRLQVIP